MPNDKKKDVFKLPEFPSLYTEEDVKRQRELKGLLERMRTSYEERGFAPEVYKQKPLAERLWRDIAASISPGWFREEAPWEDYSFGFNPKEADEYMRKVYEEEQELDRRRSLSERAPVVQAHILVLALQGKPVTSLAYLLSAVPELGEMSEDEQNWFLNYARAMTGEGEKVSELALITPEDIEERLRLAGLTVDPRFILSTVAFSKDISEIKTALQQAYPPEVEELSEEEQKEQLVAQWRTMVEEIGLTPEPGESLDAFYERVREELLKQTPEEAPPEEIPITLTDEETGTVTQAILMPETGNIMVGGEQVATFNPETNMVLPVIPAGGGTFALLDRIYTVSNDNVVSTEGAPIATYNPTTGDITSVTLTAYNEYLESLGRGRTGFLTKLMPISQEEMPEGVLSYGRAAFLGKELENYYGNLSLYDRAKGTFYAGTGDVISSTGIVLRRLGIEGLGTDWQNVGREMQETWLPSFAVGEFDVSDLLKPEWWAGGAVMRSLPFMLSLLPAAVVGGYGGVLLAGRLGLGSFAKVVFGALGAASLSRPMESAFEGASAYEAAIAQGMSEEEANKAFAGTFWKNMTLVGMDAAEFFVAFAPFPGGGSTSRVLLKRILAVVGKVGVVGALEAGEEGLQDIFLRQELGQEIALDPQMTEAMVTGGVYGIGLVGAGEVFNAFTGRIKNGMPPGAVATLDDTTAKGIGEGLTPQQATLRALDAYVDTPAGKAHVESVMEEMKTQIAEIEAPTRPVTREEALEAAVETSAAEMTPEISNALANLGERVAEEDLNITSTAQLSRLIDEQFTFPNKNFWSKMHYSRRITSAQKAVLQEVFDAVPPEVITGIRKIAIDGRMRNTAAKLDIEKRQIVFKSPEYLMNNRTAHHELGHALSEWKISQGDWSLIEKYANLIDMPFSRSLVELKIIKAKDVPSLWLRTHPEATNFTVYYNTYQALEEGFATDFAVYFTDPAALKKSDPEVFALFDEVYSQKAGLVKTKALEAQLYHLGYEEAEVKKMTPLQAWTHLFSDMRRSIIREFRVREERAAAKEVLSPQDEMLGKAIDEKEGMAQVEEITDMPKGKGETPTADMTRTQAVQMINREFYHAIPESPVDVAATAYWREGDFKGFVDNIPPDIEIAQEFKDSEFADVGYVSGYWMDTNRLSMAIDRGFFGKAFQKFAWFPTQRLHLAGVNYREVNKYAFNEALKKHGFDGKWSKEFEESMAALVELTSQEDTVALTDEILKRKEVQDVVGKYAAERQRRMVELAKDARRAFDARLTEVNLVRAKRGQTEIEYRKNYLPWVLETNVWGKLLGLQEKPRSIIELPPPPDFLRPSKPFNRYEMARRGGLGAYEKIRDIRKLYYDYVEITQRDIFHTEIIQLGKAYAAALREKGCPNSARLWEDYVAEAYAGIPAAFSRAIRRLVPRPMLSGLLLFRRNLTRAVFPLNWTWNFFIQTSSIGMTIPRYGVRNTLKGTEALWNPKVRKFIESEMFSYIIKQRRAGSVVFQDVGGIAEKELAFEGSWFDKAEHAANYLTRLIEQNITAVSCYAAYKDGMKRGYTGRALIEYASYGGALTQSMYNLQNLPGVLRSRELGAIFPFQTFAFEVFNTVREVTGVKVKGIRAGAYETIAATSPEGKAILMRRFSYLLKWYAVILVLNAVTDMVLNRKPWQVSSFIPMWSIMMSGLDSYNTWNFPAPVRYVSEFVEGTRAAIEYGNWKPLRNWAVRYHTLGGVQVERTLEGIEAMIEGEVKDVSGEVMFETREDEWLRTIAMGVFSTEGGKEFLNRIRGIDPAIDTVIKSISRLQDKLGTEDKAGNIYTLTNYASEVKTATTGIYPEMIDEVVGFSPLTVYLYASDQIWEDYYKLDTTTERNNYRRDNPMVDATLHFWNKVSTVRSREAASMFLQMVQNYGITKFMHQTYLPYKNISGWEVLIEE